MRLVMAGKVPYLVLAVFFAAVVGLRIAAPSDIYQDTDQSKTMSFTADVVLNGRWFLPRDQLGHITNKPPMVNWVGAVLGAMGYWNEWALKFPSLLGGAMTVVMVTWMGRRLAGQIGTNQNHRIAWVGVGCAMAYIASNNFVKHIYFIRPDMLNVTFLTAAWIAATVGMEERCRARRLWALGFWLALGAAALTKGTPALIGLVYALAAARLIHGRFAAVHRLGWWWGLPVTLILIGGWLGPAYVIDSQHVSSTLLGAQTVGRIVGEGGVGSWLFNVLSSSYIIPGGFFERFSPWSVVGIFAMILIGPRQWFSHPLGPAILWILTVMVCLLPVAQKAGSYVMPAYPATACLAVVFLMRGWKKMPVRWAAVATTAVVVAALFCGYQLLLSSSARTGSGDAVKEFARQVRPMVGDDAVVFINVAHTPIISLLGRHQVGKASAQKLASAQWIVRRVETPYPKDMARINGALIKTRPFHRTKGYSVEVVLALLDNGESGKP